MALLGSLAGAALGVGAQALLPRRAHRPAPGDGGGLQPLVERDGLGRRSRRDHRAPVRRSFRCWPSATSRRWWCSGARSRGGSRCGRDPVRLFAAAALGAVTVAIACAQAPTWGSGFGFAAGVGVALLALLGRGLAPRPHRPPQRARALALRVAAGARQPVSPREPDRGRGARPGLRRVPPRHPVPRPAQPAAATCAWTRRRSGRTSCSSTSSRTSARAWRSGSSRPAWLRGEPVPIVPMRIQSIKGVDASRILAARLRGARAAGAGRCAASTGAPYRDVEAPTETHGRR